MPGTLDIDPHGRLATSDEARRVLADRAGRFALLPSSPDLLVLARTPAQGGPATSPRCVLAGDLSAFPIADFLAFIHTTRVSGLLTVSAGGVERAIAFKGGEVRAATSQAVIERVGEVALRLGYVTREQLDSVDPEGQRMGQALVERGYLTQADLTKCFQEQVTTVFHAVLLAQEGVFHLDDQADLDIGAPLSLGTQSLLMDGIRRIDEMSLFTSLIPSAHPYVRRREPPRAVTLQPEEAALLRLVDGRRRVSDVAHAGRVSEFDAMKILYHLAEAGYVEAVDSPAAPAPEPGTTAIVDRVRATNEALRRIAAAAAGPAGAAEELEAALRGFLADPASRFAPLFKRVALLPDGALDEPTLLGNLSLLTAAALRGVDRSGSRARYLGDALRELLFFALFQVGERLPPDADEALLADVKGVLARAGGLGG